MAMGGGGGRGEVTSEINVTPMADVMLVLLIIFMVVTPMLQKGVSVELAKTKNPIDMTEADKEDSVLVAVTRDGKFYLESGRVNIDDLAAKVTDLLSRQAGQDGFRKGRFPRQVRRRRPGRRQHPSCRRRQDRFVDRKTRRAGTQIGGST